MTAHQPRFRARSVMCDSERMRSLWFDVYRRVMLARFGVLVLDEFALVDLERMTTRAAFDGLHFILFSPTQPESCAIDFTHKEVRGAVGNARRQLNHVLNRR